jgi:purine-nucleoside phosphorylase
VSPSRTAGNGASLEFARANAAAKNILARTKLRPRIGIVLGSGLGGFADELTAATRIPYSRIPKFPRSTAVGHAGQLVIGKLGEKGGDIAIAAMQGRVHFYEGYPLSEVIFPMRVFARMGIRAVILTNAAGGINRNYGQGALVVLSDHINLQGSNPLIGANDERFGPRFPDMTHAYNRNFRKAALDEGGKLGMVIHEGVYAGLSGPSYESPAEIRFLATIGADLVGMSTVPEVIAARHMGIEVLGISCVTNMAAGILDQALNHEEVLATGARVKNQFIALLRAVIPYIASEVENAGAKK